jgi:hypothetical protein
MLATVAGEGAEAVRIDGFAGQPAEIARLGEEIDRSTGIPVETRAHPVSSAQCSALSFASRLGGVAPTLSLQPERTTIHSSELLNGRIRNFGKTMLYLLVVDDDGKVEEVTNLFEETDGGIGFSAPMTLTDGPVGTVQLLMAIGSDQPLATIADRDGEPADIYFAALANEIAQTGARIEYGIVSFVVQ